MSQSEATKKLRDLLKLLHGLPDNGCLLVVPKAKRQLRRSIKGEDFRGTQYIGVTKNANCFQAMLMVRHRKRYIGTYKSAEEAAREFDKYSLWYRGLEVSNHHWNIQGGTNFSYTKEQIMELLKEEFDRLLL